MKTNDLKTTYEITIKDKKQVVEKDSIEKILNLNDEKYFIYIKTNEKKKKVLDDIILYALYAKINGYERAYVYNEKTDNKIIYIDSFNDVYYVDIKKTEKDDDLVELAELYFKGNNYSIIEETPKELKKEFGGNKELLQLSLLGVLVIVLIVIGYFTYDSFFPKIQNTVAPQPRPTVKPLSKKELNNLKRVATASIVNEISKKVKTIYENNDYKERKKIINVIISYEIAPVVQPIQKKDGSWYFPSEPRRGALKPKIQFIHEESYPEVGYSFVSDGLYSKTDYVSLFYSEKDKTSNIPPLTEKCILQLINKDFNSFVYHRRENDIEIFFKNTNPSLLLKNMYLAIKSCPVYFQKLTISNSKAEGSIVLFRPSKELL